MVDISETIGEIRQAESDADSIIEDANKKSTEMIQEARLKVEEDVEKAKEEAQDEVKHILLAKEEEAGKEATIITNQSESDLKDSLRGSQNKIDDAADVIIETVL
ncbi:MAG: V-type ATP synthase subunit H [Methanosphaera sp.]|nr:V-type ATP synthase subunit H [Methanosphaera sp.]